MAFVSVIPGSTKYPKVKLEWAPNGTPMQEPGDPTPTWVDITSSWRGLEWTYGRNDETGSIEAGRGYILLSNADRRFDPTYTGGTWYGNLKPRRPFRYTPANSGGTAYSAPWYFYARGFTQAWPAAGFDSVCKVDVVDLLDVAQRIEFPIGYTRPEETVSARLTAITGDFGIPFAVLSSCSTTVVALDVEDAGQSVLAHGRTVAEGEGGILFQGRNGYLQYFPKQSLITRSSGGVSFNFTDDKTARGTAIHYLTDFEPVQNDNYIVNSSTVTGGEDGVIGSSAGIASQDEFNIFSRSYSSLLSKTTDCEDMAQYATFRYSQPVLRAPRIAVDLASSGTLVHDALLDSEPIGLRCVIKRYATSANVLTLDQRIEGVTHSISPGRYTMEFATTPADLSSYWTIETSTLGTIDSTNLIAP